MKRVLSTALVIAGIGFASVMAFGASPAVAAQPAAKPASVCGPETRPDPKCGSGLRNYTVCYSKKQIVSQTIGQCSPKTPAPPRKPAT